MLVLDGVEDHDEVALLAAPGGDMLLHVALDGGLEFPLNPLKTFQSNLDKPFEFFGNLARDKAVPMLDLVEQAEQGSFVAFG